MEDKDKRVDWLRELKEGDKVIISGGYRKAIRKIDKITPTGRIKIDDIQYDCMGYEMSSNIWNRNHSLHQWTQEQESQLIHLAKFQKMCCKLSEIVKKYFLPIEEK